MLNLCGKSEYYQGGGKYKTMVEVLRCWGGLQFFHMGSESKWVWLVRRASAVVVCKFLVCNISRFSHFRFCDYQFARYFGYFDCVFAMISSNVGDSGYRSTFETVNPLQTCWFSATSLPPSWWTSCRTQATNRFARGLMPPKAYNLALSWTGTYFLVAMVVLNIYTDLPDLKYTRCHVTGFVQMHLE